MTILWWHSILFASIFSLIGLGLITLVFSRNSFTHNKAVPFALMYGLGVLAWLASLAFTQFVAHSYAAHQLAFAAVYVVTIGMLGLALTFPNSPMSLRFRRIIVIDAGLGLVGIALIFFTNSIIRAENFTAGHPQRIATTGKVYLLLVALNIVLGVIVFVRRYLREVRNRLYFNYIVLSFIGLCVIGSITNLILPLAGFVAFSLVGPVAALLPFIAVVYALGISDLNDVTYVVAQFAQASIRMGGVVGLIGTGWLLHKLGGIAYYSSTWIVLLSVAALVGVIYGFLLGPRLDRRIQEAIAYARLSPDTARTTLIAGLSGEIELERNAVLIIRFLKQALGIRSASISLLAKDGTYWAFGDSPITLDEYKECLNAVQDVAATMSSDQTLIPLLRLSVPVAKLLQRYAIQEVKLLHTESGAIGLYLLGEKFSQDIFTRQDMQIINAITEISDLSIERALFYDQTRAFNATLQQRVNDATVRLRKANRRLKTLDSLKDDFISMASHQLRSPATSVHDAIQMLEQDYLKPAERRRIIELAAASSERLVNVITDMLSVARIQAGHFDLEKTEVDLGELTDRSILQASALAHEKSITVEVDKPANALIAHVDRAKVNEIMANYIENAIKYSAQGTTVRIVLEAADERVDFRVYDRGMGVPEAERGHLFAKFYRATNARHDHPNGNGIGLFVVKTVAQTHGGDVYYEPQTKGSMFGFWLPLAAPLA